MLWLYEPGPVQLLDKAQIVPPPSARRVFEDFAAPAAAELLAGDQALLPSQELAASALGIQLGPEFDPHTAELEAEVNVQLQTLSQIDPGPTLDGARQTIEDIGGLAGLAPPEGSSVPALAMDPDIVRENPLGAVTYQEAGDGGGGPEI